MFRREAMLGADRTSFSAKIQILKFQKLSEISVFCDKFCDFFFH
jgi:hypothetical protein